MTAVVNKHLAGGPDGIHINMPLCILRPGGPADEVMLWTLSSAFASKFTIISDEHQSLYTIKLAVAPTCESLMILG
jgi:hypothetical protein